MKAILILCLLATLNCNFIDTAFCLIGNEKIQDTFTDVFSSIKVKDWIKMLNIIESNLSDIIDMHGYWEHPSFEAGHSWDRAYYSIKNTLMIKSKTFGTFGSISKGKCYNKPLLFQNKIILFLMSIYMKNLLCWVLGLLFMIMMLFTNFHMTKLEMNIYQDILVCQLIL